MSAVTTWTVPPDPVGAVTPVEFARRLRALMDARGRSLDSVARRSRDLGTPISRATVHNLVTAASVPRRDTLVGFLRGCGVPTREQIRWLITFDEVYPTAAAAHTGRTSATATGLPGWVRRPPRHAAVLPRAGDSRPMASAVQAELLSAAG